MSTASELEQLTLLSQLSPPADRRRGWSGAGPVCPAHVDGAGSPGCWLPGGMGLCGCGNPCVSSHCYSSQRVPLGTLQWEEDSALPEVNSWLDLPLQETRLALPAVLSKATVPTLTHRGTAAGPPRPSPRAAQPPGLQAMWGLARVPLEDACSGPYQSQERQLPWPPPFPGEASSWD